MEIPFGFNVLTEDLAFLLPLIIWGSRKKLRKYEGDD
jgi:hypothetical protein